MKLVCLQCGHTFTGGISKDELGWHSTCPICEGSFDVDFPKVAHHNRFKKSNGHKKTRIRVKAAHATPMLKVHI